MRVGVLAGVKGGVAETIPMVRPVKRGGSVTGDIA